MESNNPVLSFERVYCDYAFAIRRRIVFYLKDSVVAEDVLQEVFVKVWRSISSYDSSRGSIYSWLNSITIATCIDHTRYWKRRPFDKCSDLSAEHLLDPQSHNESFDMRNDLNMLFVGLTPGLHDVVVMIYFRGCTQKQAAEALNLPLGTVKTRQRRALELMRTHYLRNSM